MCTTPARDPMTRHPVEEDIQHLSILYRLPAPDVKAIHQALTDHLHIKLIAFVAVVDLYWRYTRGERGITGFGPNLLYSAHERQGKTLVRYQSKEMAAVDDAMMEISRSDRNKRLLNKALGSVGVQLIENCCCGDAIIQADHVEDYLESDWYKDSNKWRSLANVYGQVIDEHDNVTLQSIPSTTEMRREYVEAYVRIWAYTNALAVFTKPNLYDYLLQLGVNPATIREIVAERSLQLVTF